MDGIRLQQLEARALDLEEQLALLRLAIDDARDEAGNDARDDGDLAAGRVTEATVDDRAPEANGPPVVDRRSLLRRTGGVAAGAIAGGAALAAATATPAAAANGDAMIVGNVNAATNATTLNGQLVVNNAATPTSLNSRLVVSSNTTNAATLRSVAGANGSDAVVGQAFGTDGTGVLASSTNGPGLEVRNGPQVIPPLSGTWQVGAFLIAGSHVHYCYAGGVGTASKWARLSGVFVPFDGPIRIYDSRPGTLPPVGTKTRFANEEERTLDLTVNSAVPAVNAPSAVVLNLTATNTNPGGYFTAWRSTVPWPGTSSVNWGAANQTVANQSTVKINGLPQIKVRCAGAGGADLVVDVVGYYL